MRHASSDIRANLRPAASGGCGREIAQAPLNQSQAMGAIMTTPSTIEAIDRP